jgi:hypothetical protein
MYQAKDNSQFQDYITDTSHGGSIQLAQHQNFDIAGYMSFALSVSWSAAGNLYSVEGTSSTHMVFHC